MGRAALRRRLRMLVARCAPFVSCAPMRHVFSKLRQFLKLRSAIAVVPPASARCRPVRENWNAMIINAVVALLVAAAVSGCGVADGREVYRGSTASRWRRLWLRLTARNGLFSRGPLPCPGKRCSTHSPRRVVAVFW
jgi:hypothetical protein